MNMNATGDGLRATGYGRIANFALDVARRPLSVAIASIP